MPRLTTLGSLTLFRDGATLLDGRRKVLALLAYLARRKGRALSRSALADLFWPDAEEARAKQSLRTALTELRSAIGEAIQADADEISLAADAVDLDASEFEADIAAGRLDHAVGLWRGDFLSGLEDVGGAPWQTWLDAERVALRKQLGWALERLVAVRQGAGQWNEAIDLAERWTRELPGDEAAATRLIIALRSAGRTSEVAAKHAALSRILRETNDAPPSAAFATLSTETRSSPPPAGPGIRGLLTPNLVGREEVLTRLTSTWAEVRGGAGRCVLVEGDDGLGKTRLLDELARFLRAGEDATVILGRAYASERDRPLSTLRPLLDELADAPGVAAAPPEVLAALGAASAAIRERFRAPAAATSMPADDAVTRLLADAAYERPVALLVDDAPMADRESARVIEALIRRPPNGVLLVLSGTPDAWSQWPVIAETRQLAQVARVALPALTPEQSRQFVSALAPMDAGSAIALADVLHRETRGRPGALQLVLGDLVERGVLTTDAAGRWTLTAPVDALVIPVPAEISERVRGRLAALSDTSRRLLESAAVIGPRVDPALLETVSGLKTDDFRSATGDILSRRLLRNSSGADRSLEFSGDAERRVVYEQIVPSTRRAMHRSAARALRATAHDEGARAAAAEHRRRGGADPRRGLAMLAGGATVAVAAILGARTLIGAPAGMPAGTQLLLADVQNLTPDSTLGGTLDLAARIGLQQSRHVSLVTASQVNDALTRMRRSTPTPVVDERLAHEIATRENLPAFIHLAIASVDSSYLITGRVIDPAQGRDLFSTSVTAEGRGAILDALDQVLKRVRRSLGESRVVSREPSLPRVTTASLEALRLYAQGRALWARGFYDPAKARWAQAVSLDSSFTLALTSLGDFYYYKGDSGIDRRTGDRYLERALANADRLTERERLALHGTIARLRGKPEDALRHARELAERFPDRDAWYSVGTQLMRQGRGRDAIAPLRRSVELDSMFYGGWINLASAFQLEDQIDSALAAYSRAVRADSNRMYWGGNVNQEWGRAFILAGREAAAESVYRIAATVGPSANRAQGLRSLAWLAMYRGRYLEAQRALEAAIALLEREPAALGEARNRWILASVLQDLGDHGRAKVQLDRAESRLAGVVPGPGFLLFLAQGRIRAGDRTSAQRLLQRMHAEANMESPLDRSAVAMLRGEISLLAGRADSAIADARRCECTANNYLGFREQLLSDAYERLSRTDSALAAAKRLEAMWQFGWEAQPGWRHVGLRLARLSLAAGDTAQARAALERQLDRWKNADADFPDLRETRRLLAALPVR